MKPLYTIAAAATLLTLSGPAWSWNEEWDYREFSGSTSGSSSSGWSYTIAINTGSTYDSWEIQQESALDALMRSLNQQQDFDPRTWSVNRYSAGSSAIRGLEGQVAKGVAAHHQSREREQGQSGSDLRQQEQRSKQLEEHLERNLGVDVR